MLVLLVAVAGDGGAEVGHHRRDPGRLVRRSMIPIFGNSVARQTARDVASPLLRGHHLDPRREQ